ncbi:MAG: hypothetical protein KatS3mg030_689 [Saprospiraceae bacterium]|nr:MAG: hypothetical protein KatS3mg030_689 [Saprospiraceae bacterium]
MQKILYILLYTSLPVLATAQLSNLRTKVLPVLPVPQLLDTLTVVPSSVQVWNPVTGAPLSPALYTLQQNTIAFDTAAMPDDVVLVRVRYRVLPFDLGRRVVRIDSSVLVRSPDEQLIGTVYDPFGSAPRPLLPQSGLEYSGTFTRGIAFGNNQSLVLNSQFNLQMAGTLGDVEILAAITDNNIPIQPEGNTQQLREFDKVFVQVTKDGNRLIAGDYELNRPPGYFMNYTKKLQGATFSRQFLLDSHRPGTLDTRASIAVARGKFARNEIAAIEGNQGPYRLQGAEGERFIIVLAGTERVYLDGQLLRRGLDADYVIDYNAGHITFMPTRLITKDSRIIVEFDYADQNYLRSLYAVNSEFKQNNLHLYLNAYSEQDGLQPIDGPLSDEELQTLRNAGDDELSAVVPTIDTLDRFNAFRVSYELRDTFVNGVLYSGILVYSTNPAKALYTAIFSEVGSGNGNYILDTQTPANGRVYRWVAPDPLTGRPTGSFEPVRRLVAPKRQQLFTAGGQYDFSKKTSLKGELALSNFDRNRLSPFDDDDNAGLAAMLGVQHALDFTPFGKKSWHLTASADYEFTQRRFRELSPYRPAEFTRDWNTSQGTNDVSIGTRQADEHLLSSGLTLQMPQAGLIVYRFGGYFRDSLYTGTRHFARYAFQQKGYDIWMQGDLLRSHSTSEQTNFLRPKAQIAIPLWRDSTAARFWKAGLYAEQELNRRYALSSAGEKADTLLPNSFRYELFKAFIETPASENFQLKSSFQRRNDHAPAGSQFNHSTRADEFAVEGQWRQSRNSRMNWNFTWRKLDVLDSTLSTQQAAQTYLGRLNWSVNVLRGVVQSATSYEIGSGQERKIEYTYLEVPTGEGTHQWIDRNGDNVVQVDEVEVAPFQDLANAVRVISFTDQLIRTNNVQFNQSLRLEPRAIWFNASGIRKLLSKFSTQSSLQIGRKVRDLPGVSPWNPFQFDIADSALVSSRTSQFHTLFFNRGHPAYEVQAGLSDNGFKQVLTSGFESKRTREYFIKIRWNISRSLSFQPRLATGTSEQGSEFFANKRYKITSFIAEPQISFQPSNDFRTTASWRYKTARNTLAPGGENLRTSALNLEAVFNQSTTTSIRAQFSLVGIRFDGQANSPVGFAMLEGLQNGRNYLWNLTLDRQIGKSIRLGISYEGRKTGSARVVHVGRAQMGAVF